MRGLRSFLALVVILAGLGAYIYFVEAERRPASDPEPAEKVFSIADAADVSELRVTAEAGDTTTIRRTDTGWDVVEPIQSSANTTAASAIASGLASLEIARIVEEAPSDLSAFGLASPRIDVGFKLNDDQEYHHLLIGDRSPTGTDLYAKTSGSNRVFLIASYQDSTFNKRTFDLRDLTALRFDRAAVDAVEIKTGERTIRLVKQDELWSLAEPIEARADNGTVEGLIGQLASAEMRSIVEETASSLEAYGLDDPVTTATLSQGSSAATLELGAESDAQRYGRDASRPIVFTLDASLMTDLQKTPGDFRRKDLFGFRPFDITRVEITLEGTTHLFEKTAPTAEGGEAVWRQLQPATRDLDQAKMNDLLAKLSNLRAESFVDSQGGTGLDAPFLTVVTRYGDANSEDRVRFGRPAEATFALAGDEPGAAEVNTRAVNDALDALKALE